MLIPEQREQILEEMAKDLDIPDAFPKKTQATIDAIQQATKAVSQIDDIFLQTISQCDRYIHLLETENAA